MRSESRTTTLNSSNVAVVTVVPASVKNALCSIPIKIVPTTLLRLHLDQCSQAFSKLCVWLPPRNKCRQRHGHSFLALEPLVNPLEIIFGSRELLPL